MLSGSLGTRIIQKNNEKTSIPPCFALETPMRSHVKKTRKAKLHVNGGVLIPPWKEIPNCFKKFNDELTGLSGGQGLRKWMNQLDLRKNANEREPPEVSNK